MALIYHRIKDGNITLKKNIYLIEQITVNFVKTGLTVILLFITMDKNNNKLQDTPNSTRRDFLKKASALAVTLPLLSFDSDGKSVRSIPKRRLGRTNEYVSLISIGGFHIGEDSLSDEESIEIMRTAVDMGVNFFDNAWSYKQGRSETLMGQALKDGYREKVILMTKIMARNVEDAKVQMETSLKRFDLDSVDLLQFHAVGARDGDVDAVYEGGLIEWALEQRSQGVFKYIGFSGHSDPIPNVEMIERGFEWDTIQIPLNIGDYHREHSYEKMVLPLAIKNDIGVIAMKSNGMGRLGRSGIATPIEGLRYTMTLPVSTVVSGIDSMDILKENLALFHNFEPYSEADMQELLARSAGQSEVIEGYRRRS